MRQYKRFEEEEEEKKCFIVLLNNDLVTYREKVEYLKGIFTITRQRKKK